MGQGEGGGCTWLVNNELGRLAGGDVRKWSEAWQLMGRLTDRMCGNCSSCINKSHFLPANAICSPDVLCWTPRISLLKCTPAFGFHFRFFNSRLLLDSVHSLVLKMWLCSLCWLLAIGMKPFCWLVVFSLVYRPRPIDIRSEWIIGWLCVYFDRSTRLVEVGCL